MVLYQQIKIQKVLKYFLPITLKSHGMI